MMTFSAEILPDFAWGSANQCEVVQTFKNVINLITMCYRKVMQKNLRRMFQ